MAAPSTTSRAPSVSELLELPYFDMIAWLFDGGEGSLHPGRLESTRVLAAAVGVTAQSKVLVVGSGPGASDVFLSSELLCATVGVERNPNMVKLATRIARERGVHHRATFVLGDALHLPFADGAFDAAVAEATLGFVDDRAAAIREMVRVTSPGGSVGIVDYFALESLPPRHVVAELAEVVGREVESLPKEQWLELFENAGASLRTWDEHPTHERRLPSDHELEALVKRRLDASYGKLEESQVARVVNTLVPKIQRANTATNEMRRHLRYAIAAFTVSAGTPGR